MQLLVLSSFAASAADSNTDFVRNIQSQYQSAWNHIPENFTTKVRDAVIQKKLTYADIANLTASAVKGYSIIKKLGFSLPEALELERDFGSDGSATGTSIPLPDGVPKHWTPQWNKVPERLQKRIADGINNRVIDPANLSECIASIQRGTDLLMSLGFSFEDSTALSQDLGDGE